MVLGKKATLLKVFSQVTSPTIGKIKIKCRIARLKLDVRYCGFTLLNSRGKFCLNVRFKECRSIEIKRQLDEIINSRSRTLHEIQPVKRYSSGMLCEISFCEWQPL